MVVFDCNGCGEALKKNQVQKHRMKCRNSHKLSCIDCGNDFYEQEYEKHTKCITEEEKYSGKNYKPKANANKGEQKQEQWTEQVQAAIDKVKMNSKLEEILKRLHDYPNIPRKKAKFINFMVNSMRVFNQKLATEAWDAISVEINSNKPVETISIEANNDIIKEEVCSKESLKENILHEIKSDKKKKKHKREDSLINNETNDNNLTIDCADQLNNSKKFKKNSYQLETVNCININNNKELNISEINNNTNKKKNNKDNKNVPTKNGFDNIKSNIEVLPCVDETCVKKEKNMENGSNINEKIFNIKKAIRYNLKNAPNQQMSINKLKKKIYKEYSKCSNEKSLIFTKENFMKKIDAKLTKINKIILSDELATLL